jgi:dTDP-4-amino-4,6-dideoxygalactose transaminase
MYNPYIVVREFEKIIADYAGSKFAVAVESCSAALFLCCEYKKVKEVTIPKFTYPSVACAIIHAGGKVKFKGEHWEGCYQLFPYKIYDGAIQFYKGMYKGGLLCISFHTKKTLPIGRGGMILTNSEKAYKWFKKSRYDGRGECPLGNDHITSLGWNMYMTPDQATRGIQLFEVLKYDWCGCSKEQGYPDLSKIKAYESRSVCN